MIFIVVRFSSLGDVIQSTAFLNTLKQLYKGSKIYYVTKEEFGELLKDQPYIDKLITLKENQSVFNLIWPLKKECDVLFDLHNNIRSHILSYFVKTKKIKRVKKHILYRYNLVKKSKILRLIIKDRMTKDNIEDQIMLINSVRDNKNIKPVLHINTTYKYEKPVIGIAPGAKWKTKQWGTDKFKDLIKELLVIIKPTIIMFGSRNESYIAKEIKYAYNSRVINFIGKLSLLETAKQVKACDVVISNDSGLMHLAVSLNVPTVAIFGPTVKEFGFYPRGNVMVVEKNLYCRPCSLHGSNNCPIGSHVCMKSITVGEVIEVVKKFLGKEHE